MRPATRTSSPSRSRYDYEAEERTRHLAAFLRLCREARARGEEWVAWIDAGCPDVRTAAGARFASEPPATRRGRSSQADA